MKSLKVLISVITLGLVAAVSSASAAEGKGKGQQSPEQQVANLEQAVGSLTADQKSKITAVYANAQQAQRAIPKEERKEKGAALMQKTRGEVRALLTPDQQAKFDKMGAGGKKKN